MLDAVRRLPSDRGSPGVGADIWPQGHGRPRVSCALGDGRCFVAGGGGKDLGGPGKRVSRGPEGGGQVDSHLEQAVQLTMSSREALHLPHQSDPVKGGPENTC